MHHGGDAWNVEDLRGDHGMTTTEKLKALFGGWFGVAWIAGFCLLAWVAFNQDAARALLSVQGG